MAGCSAPERPLLNPTHLTPPEIVTGRRMTVTDEAVADPAAPALTRVQLSPGALEILALNSDAAPRYWGWATLIWRSQPAKGWCVWESKDGGKWWPGPFIPSPGPTNHYLVYHPVFNDGVTQKLYRVQLIP